MNREQKHQNPDGEWIASLPASQQRIEKMKRRCIHFTGTMKPNCAAGVAYDKATDFSRRYPEERLACFQGGPDICPKRRFTTHEEAEAEEKEFAQSMKQLVACNLAVREDAAGRRGITGSVPCPACESGTLGYRVASNGHVWARCSTAGCVAWVE